MRDLLEFVAILLCEGEASKSFGTQAADSHSPAGTSTRRRWTICVRRSGSATTVTSRRAMRVRHCQVSGKVKSGLQHCGQEQDAEIAKRSPPPPIWLRFRRTAGAFRRMHQLPARLRLDSTASQKASVAGIDRAFFPRSGSGSIQTATVSQLCAMRGWLRVQGLHCYDTKSFAY